MSTAPAPASRRSFCREVTRRLPLFLMLFLASPPTLAHSPFPYRSTPPIELGTFVPSTSPKSVNATVEPGHSLTFAVQPPNSSQNIALLVEAWFEPSKYFELQPDPLLLASFVKTPPPSHPYRRKAVLGDFEAFWTRRNYHFLVIPSFTKILFLRLLNHNSTVQNELNATIRISIHKVPENVCPYGPGRSKCAGRGACIANQCVCQHGYGGRYCQHTVKPLSDKPFDVPSEKMLFFSYVVPQNGSVAVEMQVSSSSNLIGAQPILFAKRLGEQGSQLERGTPLPSIYDWVFADRNAVMARSTVQRVVRTGLKKGEVLYVGVYNMHRTVWLTRGHSHLSNIAFVSAHASVQVVVTAFPCVKRYPREGQRLCPPSSSQQHWEFGLNLLLLPMLLSMLILLTMVVCVSIWASVFRQQFFDVARRQPEDTSSRRDRLSEAEVNAMFPAFVFTKSETAALGATGDVCCSVCLCTFEEGEYLRRLACGHSYHSSCLDQWLLTNATCPRCRKPARIHGEIVRGSLFSRRSLRAISGRLRFFVAWFSARVGIARATANLDGDQEVRHLFLAEQETNEHFGEEAL
ncbi:putative RING-H2 finger protein ATL36 [Gracilariopsis chorda]|uniref:Putative RING-H2 finger protein ATL36 n=1 Tax=Gracilariopsis chorda TaxID=448386 RepID=A0A2V3IYJ2_9FLOR|nr:putative RING-H2 finger protein ATL36 [Gracilariopsis chorda]|eukprot:PXF47133.1 putative RING-H2 finger protein ATL36 [Gracilariopsis chorda]